MSKTMENVKTANSVVRTLLLVGFLGGFGYLGVLGYNNFIKPGLEAERIKKEMAELQVKYEEQERELTRTRTALKLVKVDHRRALIKVLDKGVDEETEEPYFVVEFIEVDTDGLPISETREFRLRGTLMFVDSWVVKFEDKYVEQADELRSASLCVFKSIWGDLDERSGGQRLDTNDASVNTAYGTLDPKNSFEQQIWDDFWALANDPRRQQELGIRGNHGQVNYLQVEPGMVYQVDLRASDGLTLKAAAESNTSVAAPSG
ncbi:MAG: hypothetical protein ACR2NP_12915 [Pirellulaceae bacterium]